MGAQAVQDKAAGVAAGLLMPNGLRDPQHAREKRGREESYVYSAAISGCRAFMSLPLSIFIIAHNEAKRIGRTIEAIKNLSDDLIVVDSGSTDGTRAIAESLGAKVIHHTWEGYGRQKQFAEAQCRHDWRLNLDADEVVTPELNSEIQALFSQAESPRPCAYSIRIIDVIPGDTKPRPFAYAHEYVRLYHKEAGQYPISTVHDVVHVKPGFPVRRLEQCIHHFSVVNLSRQIEKYNNYTNALVEDLKDRNTNKSFIRLFTEFPLAFFKTYFLRRHLMRGRYGYLTAMNYAFFRYLRLAKHFEQRVTKISAQG
ncbi:MAG TPA: glycosyltransferase family 2 protein [Rhodanobacteraceae bacterium]